MRRGSAIGSPSLRPNWCASKLISSWRSGTGGSGSQESDKNGSHRYGRHGIDPVEAGYIESLAHPGGNVTGPTTLTENLAVSDWSCSKKRFPNLAVSRFSTTRPV